MDFLSCILRGGYTSLARLIVSLTGPKAVNGYGVCSDWAAVRRKGASLVASFLNWAAQSPLK